MPVDFKWLDEGKTLLRFTASGAWTWKDLHRVLTLASTTLTFNKVAHAVDFILDLGGGDRVPAGAMAHLRSLAKPLNVNTPPRLIVIGIDAETQRLVGAVEGVYRPPGNTGTVYFVDSAEAADALIALWRGDQEQPDSTI